MFQVTARQAERKLEESKQEAAQLRNRLIIVEKNVINTSKSGETPVMNDREWTSYLFICIFVVNSFGFDLKGTNCILVWVTEYFTYF
jgi:hypothetical protein